MQNQKFNAEERFLTQTQTELPKKWVKPTLTAMPLSKALSGGTTAADAFSGGGAVVSFSS